MKKLIAVSLLLLTSQIHARTVDPFNPTNSEQPIVQAPSGESAWSWSSVKAVARQKLAQWIPALAGSPQRGMGDPAVSGAVQESRAPGAETETETETAVTQSPVQTTKLKPDFFKSAQAIKNQDVVKLARPAIAASPKLAKTRSGVAYLDTKKLDMLKRQAVPKIPLLSIGREAELAEHGFEALELENIPLVAFESTAELKSVPVASRKDHDLLLGASSVLKASGAEKLEIPALSADQKVTLQKVASLTYSTEGEKPVQPMEVIAFNEEDLRMLRALILYEKKDLCHQAAGLFSSLVGSKNEDVKTTASYHLAMCLHEMNLPLEALHYFEKTIHSEDPRFLPTSVKMALSESSLRFEEQLAKTLLSVRDRAGLDKAVDTEENYLLAKYYLRKGMFDKSVSHAERITDQDPHYFKAQYVTAVAEYLMGKHSESLLRQRALVQALLKKGGDKDVLALVNLNLGRVAFQTGKYKEAVDAFQLVPKEHPLWMQTLTELGWAQLQGKDAPGAIGNMHSIQSPYFDGAYKAESYVVRTIGYLDICQYGDANKTLSYFEGRYQPWLAKVESYLSGKTGNGALYQTSLKYLGNVKSTGDVDGLPYQVIREVARQKDFLNAQESINAFVDEAEGYGFIQNLIAKDRKTLLARKSQFSRRIGELQGLLKKADTSPGLAKNINPWKAELRSNQEFLEINGFKLEVLAESEKEFQTLRSQAIARITQAKNHWKEVAGVALRKHLKNLKTELERALANNEFLRYEVFAGSGENLRSQMAGAAPGKKLPAGRLPAQQKTANDKTKWEFEGEFWEDEIGHYRSSLKNNCPNQMAHKESL